MLSTPNCVTVQGRNKGLSVVNPSSGELPAETEPVSEFERDVALLARAENRDPFRLLGPHIVEVNEEQRLVVRGFFPRATQASLILKDRSDTISASSISPEGLFEATLPLQAQLPIPANSYRCLLYTSPSPRD